MGVLVFDSAPLSGFARAEALSLLGQLPAGEERVTTAAVMEELCAGVSEHPRLRDVHELPWLRVVSTDSLEVLRRFVIYANRLGSGLHDVGEATVLAYAEAHGAIAFSDDQAAVQVGRERGVKVQRTLSLVARGLRRGILSEGTAHKLIENLARAGARFPCAPGEFLPWARAAGLLGS